MIGDAASRLQATELCVTLRVTEDFYIITQFSGFSGLSRLSGHKREVVGEELSGHSVHEAWKALVVWAATISESLPMAVSTARLVLIRRATAKGSRPSGMFLRSGVWRSISWAAAFRFKSPEMKPLSPISRPRIVP